MDKNGKFFFLLLIPFSLLSWRPVFTFRNMCPTGSIQNEATLTIEGPGFNKEKQYGFLPDMITVGGYEKAEKMTKTGFSTTFTDERSETITISINIDLLTVGTLELDPDKDGPAAHAGIAYQKVFFGRNERP